MFLANKYSPDIIKNAWTEYALGASAPDTVFQKAIIKYDTTLSFKKAFYEFGSWMLYAGTRASLKKTFDDAALFPSIRIDSLKDSNYILNPFSLIYFRPNAVLPETSLTFNSIGDIKAEIGLYTSNISNDSLLSDSICSLDLSTEHTIPITPQSAYLGLFNANPFPITFTLGNNNSPIEQAKSPYNSFVLSASPNPFNKLLSIHFPCRKPDIINVYDVKGSLVTSITEIRGHSVQLNAVNLTSGIYVLKAYFQKRIKTLKLIYTK